MYEWGMGDLNEKKITLRTKGNAVFTQLETAGGRELIEAMKNGEVEDYKKTVTIQAGSVEEVREIVAALKHLTGVVPD